MIVAARRFLLRACVVALAAVAASCQGTTASSSVQQGAGCFKA